jgi:hypothetical protein
MAKRDISDYQYVPCRTIGHSWDEIEDDGGVRRQFKNSRTVKRLLFRCTRCKMLRYEAWSPITGSILFRSYVRPEDFALGGRVKRDVFRREYLNL